MDRDTVTWHLPSRVKGAQAKWLKKNGGEGVLTANQQRGV